MEIVREYVSGAISLKKMGRRGSANILFSLLVITKVSYYTLAFDSEWCMCA